MGRRRLGRRDVKAGGCAVPAGEGCYVMALFNHEGEHVLPHLVCVVGLLAPSCLNDRALLVRWGSKPAQTPPHTSGREPAWMLSLAGRARCGMAVVPSLLPTAKPII